MEEDYSEADHGEESTYYDFLRRISLHVPHYPAEATISSITHKRER